VVHHRPELHVGPSELAAKVAKLVWVSDPPPVKRADDDPVELAAAANLEEPLEVFSLVRAVAFLLVLKAQMLGDLDPLLLAPAKDVLPLVFELLP